MFRQLILDVLSEGPKSTREQYAVAEKRQPRDCADTPALIGKASARGIRSGSTSSGATNFSSSAMGGLH